MEFRRVLYRSLLADLREAAATSYPVKAERLAALSNPGNVAAEIQRRIDQLILPSFDALVMQLDEFYESRAPDGVGMDKLPGGKAVYADLVHMHTTMNLTPEQVHAAGHARMARIQAQMAEVRKRLDFSGTEAEFASHMRKPQGAVAASSDEIGERMREQQDEVEKSVDEFFAQRSDSDLKSKRLNYS